MSLESSPNILSVAPAIAAASGRVVPMAVAKCRTDSCICMIAPSLKPSFASSVWSSVTCEAVYSVVRPSSIAEYVSASMSLTFLPMMVERLTLACSKSTIFWNALATPLTAPAIAANAAKAPALTLDSFSSAPLVCPDCEVSSLSLALVCWTSALSFFQFSVPGTALLRAVCVSFRWFRSSANVLFSREMASLSLLYFSRHSVRVFSWSFRVFVRFWCSCEPVLPAFSRFLSSVLVLLVELCKSFICLSSASISFLPPSPLTIRFSRRSSSVILLAIISRDFMAQK